jgi:hypothetical protein
LSYLFTLLYILYFILKVEYTCKRSENSCTRNVGKATFRRAFNDCSLFILQAKVGFILLRAALGSVFGMTRETLARQWITLPNTCQV